MDVVVRFIIDFVLLTILIYLVHMLYYNRKKSVYKELKKNDEVKLFIARYNLDMRKTDYKLVLRVVALCNAIIISFTATLALNIHNYIWKILISFVVIFVLIYALFEICGRLLKKKEIDKNV